MSDDLHKPGLYRWKRKEDPRVYSRSQNVTSNNDIVNWIQKVEDASNRAAEHVFGSSYTSGRAKGKAVARATKEYMQDDEQAYSEAQDLLSQWMEEKVHLQSHLDPEIDCNYDDDDWQKYEIESDVKKQWDKMLANNYDEYGLSFSEDPREKYGDLYNFNEDEAVDSVMKNMLSKQVVKKEFKKDLGLDKWGRQVDPKQKMEIRRQQVKENREKRDEELQKKREEERRKKETVHSAKQMVLQEERLKELQSRREEMAIRKEMAKIRKEMQSDRKKNEEKKAKDKQAKEETLYAARVKVAWDMQEEDAKSIEDQRREEEKHRVLAERLVELEKREAANNMKVLHRHFSAWYNVVLERRLKMGKAHAMYDWKLLLRAWNAWRGYVRNQRLDREHQRHQLDVVHTQRNQQTANKHHRLKTLRKHFIAWQVWVQGEKDRRALVKAQTDTRSKMASLLEAAASGKLRGPSELQPSTDRSTHRSRSSSARSNVSKDRNMNSSEKIDALFEQTRRIPDVHDSMSTDRSDLSTPTDNHNPHNHNAHNSNSRIPHEPWQVTRKHLNLTPEELAQMQAEHPDCSPEEMNAKILKIKKQKITAKAKSKKKQTVAKTLHRSRQTDVHKTDQKPVQKKKENIDTARSTTATTARPDSARTNVSRPSSYTSTASEKSKYLTVLNKMNDRAAERARLKAERDEKRRLAEEERVRQLEEEAALIKKKEEEEKKARAEAFRERKRLEKQREMERQLQEEKLRQQNEMADRHYEKSILKYRGLLPFKVLVRMAKENKQKAVTHFNSTLKRKALLGWYHHVKDQWREKEELADEMHKFLAVKHCFQSWRLYKHHMVIEEHKAKRHYQCKIKSKIFQVWRDYANEEKVASWERDRISREHYKKLLLRRHFKAWRSLPDEIIKEKEREKRRRELREKVAALLPDFEPTTSVTESTELALP